MVDITVIGCGGAGSNIVKDIRCESDNVRYITINNNPNSHISTTKNEVLAISSLLGNKIEYPEKNLFLESIKNCLFGDTVFIITGVGGMMGENISKIVCDIARKKRLRIYGIFIYPFKVEGEERLIKADKAIENIKNSYDFYTLLENDKPTFISRNLPFVKVFEIQSKLIGEIVKGISILQLEDLDLLNKKFEGNINVGIGAGERYDRVIKAINDAIKSPWLCDEDINNAFMLFFGDVTEMEINRVLKIFPIEDIDIKIIHNMSEKVRVLIFAE